MNKDRMPGQSGNAWVPIAAGHVDARGDGRAGYAQDVDSGREMKEPDPEVGESPERRLDPARGFLLAVVVGLIIWVVVLSALAKLI